ncbi:MAG: magnesium transporter [Phycisphaerales bacterium]|nr:magnesium transporter [Phycisphaerales bacterium]
MSELRDDLQGEVLPIEPDDGAPDDSVDLETVAERVETMVEEDAPVAEIAQVVEQQDAPDAADIIERLDPEEQGKLVHEMDDEAAAEALAHMDPALAATVVRDLDNTEAARLIELMADDDAADLLQSMPEVERSAVLELVHPRRAAVLGKLALYPADTAGGIMTTDILVVRSSLTIGRAIERVKRLSINEDQLDLYCVDDQQRLQGVISLRDLLVTDDAEIVGDHMDRDIEAVRPEDDQEEVARLFERYDYLALPVIDHQERVLGMITVDDVIDIIAEETTEDALKQVGAGAREAVYSTLGAKLRGRTPWLVVNLLTATIAASVLLAFHDLIELIPIAAVIFPVIANQVGNAGNQSLAVTLRGIVLGEIHAQRVRPLIMKEAAFGLVSGVLVGAILTIATGLLGMLGRSIELGFVNDFTWPIAIVAGIAMAGALMVGCLIGTLIPLFMERVGIDPATASSIFLTMLTDMLSFAAFLGLVFLLQGWIAPEAVGSDAGPMEVAPIMHPQGPG